MCKDCCSEETTSKLGSPGIIDNSEYILNVVFHPDSYKDGIYSPDPDQLKDEEFSVARLSYVSEKIVRDQVLTPRTKSGQTYVGILLAQAGRIRSISFAPEPTHRVFCVVDAPEPNYVGHGVVGLSRPLRGTKKWSRTQNVLAAVIGELAVAFEEAGMVTIENCFAS